jgi:AcrR family transcriptional regulator
MIKEKNERSKQDITFALLQLLNNGTKYIDISVTDICKHALISRKTFYNHFQTKDDIIKYLMKKVIKDFMRLYPTSQMTFLEIMEQTFVGFKKSKNVLLTFYENNLLRISAQAATAYLNELKEIIHYAVNENDDWHKIYLPSLVVLNLSDILLIWIKNDFKESPVELAHVFEEYLKGLVPNI